MMVSYAHDISDWQVSVLEGYISAVLLSEF